jgi:diacylglycerol kinase family enzyme
MADPQQSALDADKGNQHVTITLPGPDGTFDAAVTLQVSQDAATPPRLLKVEKRSTDSTSLPVLVQDQETHIILSTGSGHRKADDFFNQCVHPLLTTLYPKTHHDFHVHTTQSADSVLELATNVFFPKANQGTRLRIIVLSGDGGVVDLVNGLSSHPMSAAYVAPQVVLLPLGTANALYHSINMGKDKNWGLAALASSQSRPLPTFTASFSPGARLLVDEARSEEELAIDVTSGHPTLHGAVVCSWGMHASLVADSDTAEYRKFGVERFKMAAKEALYPADGSLPHAYKAQVSLLQSGEWQVLGSKEHLYVLVPMVSHLEETFCISPGTKPLDGSMHVVYFGPTNGDEAMRLMGLAYQGGKHVGEDAIQYETIDGLRVDFQDLEPGHEGRWRRICVDGKIVRVESDGWVEVRKEARRVMEVVEG